MGHQDSTLNVLPLCEGRAVKALSEGGLQYLLAASRANAAVKGGRYLFEARIVEMLNPVESGRVSGQAMPRQHVRVGFSVQGSPLLPAADSDGIALFDSEGFYNSGRGRLPVAQMRLGRGQVIGVLLNLEPASPNANTMSLFIDGVRASKPQPLAPGMLGKALCPHVAFRNVTVQLHFGPSPLAPLPFKCRMLQEAAAADVEIKTYREPPDGKHEVVLPIGLPDEGLVPWVDHFLEEHPEFVELSDRKIVDWAVRSGLVKTSTNSWKNSSDRPDVTFGISVLDELGVRKVRGVIAALIPRNYVVLEVKSNCIKTEREEILSRFPAAQYRRVAHVAIGAPPSGWVQKLHDEILQEKQQKLTAEWKLKQAMKPQGDEQKMEVDDTAKEDSKAADEVKAEVKEELGSDEPPKAQLTEEEQKIRFKPQAQPDLNELALGQVMRLCVLPDADEGFDQVTFVWEDEAGAQDRIKSWVLERKATTCVQDLEPTQWFFAEQGEWHRQLQAWMILAKQRRALRGEDIPDGDEVPAPTSGIEEGDESGAPDPATVENVLDVGTGEPLFSKFSYTDWALISLRYELHLLVRAFQKDVHDPERLGMHESHLAFYYNRYFRKPLNLQAYGASTVRGLVELFEDTLALDSPLPLLVSKLTEEETTKRFDMFLKLAERDRRDRLCRIATGDASARLVVQRNVAPQLPVLPQAMQQQLGMARAGGNFPPPPASSLGGLSRIVLPPPPNPGANSKAPGGWQPHHQHEYGQKGGYGSYVAQQPSYATPPPGHQDQSGYSQGKWAGGKGSWGQ